MSIPSFSCKYILPQFPHLLKEKKGGGDINVLGEIGGGGGTCL